MLHFKALEKKKQPNSKHYIGRDNQKQPEINELEMKKYNQ